LWSTAGEEQGGEGGGREGVMFINKL